MWNLMTPFCLQLIVLICLLLIDVTQRSVLSAASSQERRREQELVQRRQESSPSVLGWLPLGLEREAENPTLPLALAIAACCWPVGE